MSPRSRSLASCALDAWELHVQWVARAARYRRMRSFTVARHCLYMACATRTQFELLFDASEVRR